MSHEFDIVVWGATGFTGRLVAEYLVDQYGSGRLIPPPNSPDRLQYVKWMHYAEGSTMPLLLLKLVFDRMEKSPAPFFVRPVIRSIAKRAKSSFVQPQIDLHLDYLESELRVAALLSRFSNAHHALDGITAQLLKSFLHLKCAFVWCAPGASAATLTGIGPSCHLSPYYFLLLLQLW